MLQTTIQSWQRSIQRQVKQQPGRTGLLGALLIVLLLAGGRMVLSDKAAPSVALAARQGPTIAGASPAPTESRRDVAGASAAVLNWLDAPAAPLMRNPYYIRYEIFPPDATKPQETLGGRGFWDEIAKSLTVAVDEEEKKHEKLQDLQRRASELRVASVMMGPSPRALIDDKLVGEGDVVANFRVLKIEARRIIVEAEGIRLEIQMK
ncbi:MAG TPA: hypothetical protein PLD59_10240 [Tepidisphaeraceae bacterium]|nr:hypothetical protein [Tepidisphaeraceae bacterium]